MTTPSAVAWTPDLQAVDQLKLIIGSTFSSNNVERNAANESLVLAKSQPQIENYLLYILVMDESAKSDVRAASGINLKNIISRSSSGSPETHQFILDNIAHGLTSHDNMVRNTTGNVITALFSKYGLAGWPQVLPSLVNLAKSADPTAADTKIADAAMSALAKICEDSHYKLNVELEGERPLDYLMASFIELLESCSNRVKALSIECIDYFIPHRSQSVLVVLDVFLQKLFQLAHNSNKDVKKSVCKAFASVLEARGDKLLPHVDGVITYCLHLMEDEDEEVALEACEFLLALSTSPEVEQNPEIFRGRLHDVLPALLEKMVYSEEEIFFMNLVDEKDDATVADNEEDIRPQAAKSKESHKAASKSGNKNNSYDDNDDSDDEDFEDDSDDDSELDQWSIRKCSAACLDVLSLNLQSEVLEVTLPILQERIVSSHKSCMELSRDKLPTLVPFLVDRLQDDEPRVRQITCWTISRFSSWVAEEAHEGGHYSSYFDPTFTSILKCALDRKKVVQEAACSALSSFIEETDPTLIEMYLVPLLQHFAKCFSTYQRKNLIILYDCVQTFVEAMGHERLAAKQEYVEVLLPPLLHKWELLDDNDTALWPLLECMASIAATLGELFAPYAMPVYGRAVNILTNTIHTDLQSQTDPSIDLPEKDFMVTSLDLIDGLIQGFGSHSLELIQSNRINLMELVLQCFEDSTDDVRQSAYALLGDLAIFVLDATVVPYLNQIMVCIGNEINTRNFNSYPVYNNAIWSLGEICMRLSYEQLKPYLANLVSLLIPVLNSMDTPQTVLENAAICLGRMGLHGGAEVVGPRLPEFIVQWCAHMLYLMDDSEKETGFKGMLNTIASNPDQGFGGLSTLQGKKNLSTFISTVANYFEPPEDLKHSFSQLLQSYSGLLGENFNTQVLNHLDQESRRSLYEMYGI
ncbi:ARM repeat-containing protein [Yamadazyma tenuis ATCC 10573]|uniref:ARM repeat-containing protein n=1 Tax=Candida tenuis (strain ATCC 10573 / BCRC 21748 / CBS 615 / JCM 9827 / NBRC 10315 / NRRL Y-1498 / VKM Y-70) TaxID=590646 RepID=G3BB33_CANTC|nr:ARM repeat-containing protein [Yamadazyma tenuis ATCC 10573]EGV62128.1 ARM repeat-containing protein [Yamadazyma tenuis ATCC 10573]